MGRARGTAEVPSTPCRMANQWRGVAYAGLASTSGQRAAWSA
jgi:hypothetical protein